MDSPSNMFKFVYLATLLLEGTAASRFGSPTYSNNFGIPGVNATYDYVIVGGGTAGLALASRLAENQTISIAVIEAGGFYEQESGNQTLVPGYYIPNTAVQSINWNFETAPQPQLYGNTVSYARGRTLGGSSALNAMLYQRSTVGAQQAWANAVGDESYTFENLLPFYEMSANYTVPDTMKRATNASVPSQRGYKAGGGPLHVSFPNSAAPFSSWGQLGLRAIGIADIEDFSSGALIGSQYCPLTIRPDDQTRSSSEASYLQASFARNELYPNMAIYIHTMAEKIVFDGNVTATGVLVKSNGVSYLLNATKEVVVSAGTFQSPQLLMVSGIGPKAELDKHNITIIANRPGVGGNMWDHVLWPVTHQINTASVSVLQDPIEAARQSQLYNINQTGILTTNNAEYLGWEKVPANYKANMSATAIRDLATFPADWPDIEHVVINFNPGTYLAGNISYGTLEPALITPLSRGNISLNSSSMDDPPIINVGWLTNKTDLETGVIAIKRAREFWAATVMQGVIVGPEVLPGENISTDAQIEDWLRSHVQTVYHASCTCKMGKLSDPLAVTDSRARVIGVSALRVVDASTFPLLPPGHPQSTIYALAEKIAHHIITGT